MDQTGAKNSWGKCLLLSVVMFATAQATPISRPSTVTSLEELQSVFTAQGRAVRPLRLEGTICAIASDRTLLALQDSSGTVLLEGAALDKKFQPGDRVILRGDNCTITRSAFGFQLGTAPAVDADGEHGVQDKSGKVYLKEGRQPIQLRWFNAGGSSFLKLEWEGPNLPRQEVSASALWRKVADKAGLTAFQHGLQFESYVGKNWHALPNFEELKPVARGTATNFLLQYRARDEETALVFMGYVQIPKAALYTFTLTSDDGSELYVGDPAAGYEVIGLKRQPTPIPESLAEASLKPGISQWTAVTGVVSFIDFDKNEVELERGAGEKPVQLTVVDGSSAGLANLLHCKIRAMGVWEKSAEEEVDTRPLIMVPSLNQTEIVEDNSSARVPDLQPDIPLTSVVQIRRLKPKDAVNRIRTRIVGVVTWAMPYGFVLQDPTGGVFVHKASSDWTDQPRLGDFLEVEGTTDAGDFSPVVYAKSVTFLGMAAFPEPIHPTWDQLMNGSLDAEYTEVRGVLTAVSDTEMTLLTADGVLKITSNADYPLPRLPSTPGKAGSASDFSSYVDKVIRIRGCLTAVWNYATRQVKAGEIHLTPALVSVEDTEANDPFSIPSIKTVDLLRFNAYANALQRIRVTGQIIYAAPHEYYLQDGNYGLRLRTKEVVSLQPGDLVEAVGFPHLDGATSILQEARIRRTGHTDLLSPAQVSADDLPDQKLDATLVRVEARVVSNALLIDQRVLELQAGPHRFLAILRLDKKLPAPVLPGSWLQLTGVYSSARENLAGISRDPFELLLNNAAAISVLQQPSWWTLRRALAMAMVLAGGLGLTLIWIMLLHRKVEERTRQLQKEIEGRQQVEQHRAMEQERIRVAQDLHDELGVGLTQVGILGSLARNPLLSTERKNYYLEHLSEAARALVTGLDEIVWAVNPKYDMVSSLGSYYALFAERFLHLAGIACRFDASENLPDYPLDSRLRHGIFLAFKEALNNIVRHSGATEIRLKIAFVEEQLTISLADNGYGFDPDSRQPGSDGIVGMHKRMEKLGGQCVVHSRPGEGTIVELSLPLGKNRS